MSTQKRLAVLIDADNVNLPESDFQNIFEELNARGTMIVKRAYGDFSHAHLKNWKELTNNLGISTIHQFSYTTGKNSTDSRMIIDAMDLLYTKKIDTFVIVSNDSDFTSLASRLREAEVEVVGVGKKGASKSLTSACDEFVVIEALRLDVKASAAEKGVTSSAKVAEKRAKAPVRDTLSKEREKKIDQELWQLIHRAWQKLRDDEGWVNLGEVGKYLKRLNSEFDSRNYGHAKLSDCIKHFNSKLTVKTNGGVKFRMK